MSNLKYLNMETSIKNLRITAIIFWTVRKNSINDVRIFKMCLNPHFIKKKKMTFCCSISLFLHTSEYVLFARFFSPVFFDTWQISFVISFASVQRRARSLLYTVLYANISIERWDRFYCLEMSLSKQQTRISPIDSAYVSVSYTTVLYSQWGPYSQVEELVRPFSPKLSIWFQALLLPSLFPPPCNNPSTASLESKAFPLLLSSALSSRCSSNAKRPIHALDTLSPFPRSRSGTPLHRSLFLPFLPLFVACLPHLLAMPNSPLRLCRWLPPFCWCFLLKGATSRPRLSLNMNAIYMKEIQATILAIRTLSKVSMIHRSFQRKTGSTPTSHHVLQRNKNAMLRFWIWR